MRRIVGYVCLFLGALVLMVGVLAKPVLYHNLAKVPLDQKSMSVSIGEHMSALQASAAGVKVLTDATLQNTRIVVGIPAKAKGNSAFWQYVVVSKQVGGNDLDYSQEGVSFDRVTGQATNCCGDYKSTGTVNDPTAIKKDFTHKGLFFKFPFDTQKTTYQWWDGDLGRTEPMKFLRTQQVQGVQTYVFQQRSRSGDLRQARGVPGSLFNTTKPVDADADLSEHAHALRRAQHGRRHQGRRGAEQAARGAWLRRRPDHQGHDRLHRRDHQEERYGLGFQGQAAWLRQRTADLGRHPAGPDPDGCRRVPAFGGEALGPREPIRRPRWPGRGQEGVVRPRHPRWSSRACRTSRRLGVHSTRRSRSPE